MTPRKITLNIDRIVMDRRDFHPDDLITAVKAHLATELSQGDFDASNDAVMRAVRTVDAGQIKGPMSADRVGAAVARAALGTVRR